MKPIEVLKTKTIGETSEVVLTQSKPKIQKNKRYIKKMKVSKYVEEEDAEVEETSTLVTRIEKIKKATVETSESLTAEKEAFLVEQALKVASQLEIPTTTLVKETAVEDAAEVVELTEYIKGLASKETVDLVNATMEVKREKACSGAGVSEAITSDAAKIRGSSSIHNTFDNIMNLDSTSTSSNDIPLTRIYKNLEKKT